MKEKIWSPPRRRIWSLGVYMREGDGEGGIGGLAIVRGKYFCNPTLF